MSICKAFLPACALEPASRETTASWRTGSRAPRPAPRAPCRERRPRPSRPLRLQNKDVDICVHSMKDVPTLIVPGTILPCNLPREDTSDALISSKANSISSMPGEVTIVSRTGWPMGRNRWDVTGLGGFLDPSSGHHQRPPPRGEGKQRGRPLFPPTSC